MGTQLHSGARNRIERFIGQMDVALALIHVGRIEAARVIALRMQDELNNKSLMVPPEEFAKEVPAYARAVGAMEAILEI